VHRCRGRLRRRQPRASRPLRRSQSAAAARALDDVPARALPVFAPPGAVDAVLALDRPGMLAGSYELHKFEPGSGFVAGPFQVDSRLLPHFVPNAGLRVSAGGAVLAVGAPGRRGPAAADPSVAGRRPRRRRRGGPGGVRRTRGGGRRRFRDRHTPLIAVLAILWNVGFFNTRKPTTGPICRSFLADAIHRIAGYVRRQAREAIVRQVTRMVAVAAPVRVRVVDAGRGVGDLRVSGGRLP